MVPVYLTGGPDGESEVDCNSFWGFLNGGFEGKFIVVDDWNGGW